jgi:hypothetical protein
MAETFVEPKVRAHGTIHVTLPARVAYDPGALKKSIGELMERLGCPKCFSGANCLFRFERDFIVDAKGSLVGTALGSHAEAWRSGPHPEPWAPTTVTASLTRGARFNIDKVFKAVDRVIDLIGPCPCHSGFDVFYQNELKSIGINEQLDAHQFGG